MLHLPGAAGETGRWCAVGGLERPRDPTSAGEQRRPSPSLRHGGFRQPDSGKTRARRAGGRYRPHTVHGLGLDQKDLGPPTSGAGEWVFRPEARDAPPRDDPGGGTAASGAGRGSEGGKRARAWGGSERGGRPRPPALFPPRDAPGLPPHTSHVPRAPTAAPDRARRTAQHASSHRDPRGEPTPPQHRDNAGSGHAVRRGRNPGGSAQRRATPRRPAGRRRGTHPRGAAPRATRPRREPPRQGKGGRDRRRGAGAGPRLRPPTARPRTGRGGGHGRTAAVAARGKAARTTALRIRASTPHDGPRDRAARGTAKPSRDPGGDPKDRVRHEGSPPEGPRRRAAALRYLDRMEAGEVGGGRGSPRHRQPPRRRPPRGRGRTHKRQPKAPTLPARDGGSDGG
ncbi:basic salivary proline-rich protein 1-like [Panthera pardus]|uniref:Basic salivary proline-rich protein 1-like n=1 Tax=Panthera pardus TaxID=9691 RepID=A0A9W2VGX0_PANPR|nr:basic salivary proline-rich protein 1-like [Panthera pardus]